MEMQFPVILDGATGTELQKRGFTGDMSAEQWVLEHPESILEVQRKYVASGSNVIYAPTFGGNRQKLEERGIFNRTEEMNKALALLSKQAADGKAWVAGDIAPTGRFLAPLGDASFEELVDIYTEQTAGLEQAGVDLYVIETMMTLTDARAAVLAIRSMSKKPILVSRLFCPLFAFFCPLPGEMRLHWHLVRKRRDLSILGTKRALNYKSRGIIPRLIFFSYQGAFWLIGDFL